VSYRIVIVLLAALLFAGCATEPPPADTSVPTIPPVTATEALTRVPTASQTPRPSPTPVASPTGAATADPDAPIEAVLNPQIDTYIEAPIRITVPDDWQFGSAAILLPELDGTFSTIPYSVYRGPVTGGSGTVMVLWGFPNIAPAGSGGSRTINLFADGLRLLLFVVMEPACEYSYDEQQQFLVGGLPALGTYYAADQCPENLPSMRGWFGALKVEGLSFAFYAFTEPLDVINGPALGELQSILDSVEFDLSLLPTALPVDEAVSVTVTPQE
jgi:hypothetical protein